MAKNQIALPSSGGGLMRYSDEFKSKLRVKPSYVIIAIAVAIVLEILLRLS